MKDATVEAVNEAVETAKRNAMDILKTGIVFSYGHLSRIMEDNRPIYRMIEELERRHMVVTDVPPPLSAAADEPRPSTSTAGQPAAEQPSASEASGESTDSSDQPFEPQHDVQWKRQTRKLMADKGLYQKHSLEHPLLKDFGTYLDKDLRNENFKQEVDNVARFLYYMDPAEPSLLFVRSREKTKAYLRELSEAKLTKQTQMNYLKSLKRFLHFHTVNTDLMHSDEKLHRDCAHFIQYIGSLQKSCSKLVSKEIVQKRHDMLMGKNQPTPRDCWAVLRKAKHDFLAVIGKVFPQEDPDVTPDVSECMLVVYYLQAIVILKNLQRPGVVEHMTVKEWEVRSHCSGRAVVGVMEHKTSAQQVATFALDQEEESWFETYQTKIRPRLLTSMRKKRSWGEMEAQNRFFISSTGRPIYNASNDLHRLHEKYRLKPITSQMARKIFETATKGLDDAAKSLVADYLTHSSATAEKHYRMRKTENVIKGQTLLHQLAGNSCNESSEDSPSATLNSESSADDTSNEPTTVQDAYQQMICEHPVTLDGEVPDKTVRSNVCAKFQRQLYERWIKAQMKLRVQHVLSHFGHRLPKEKRICAWIAKQGWKSNVPSPARILGDWKPTGSIQTVMESKQIQCLIASQQWKGLEVKEIDEKGKGVFATRRFLAGEVVCEYHGRVITGKEAQEINTSEADVPGCLFFYTNSGGMTMAIDARSCLCHPGQETFCHHIRHSGKNANLMPRLYRFRAEGEEKDVILFIAMKHIQCNGELTFDYGDKKESHRGEGLDLSWT